MREETCCRHMGYSFRLAARVPLYAPSHRQDSTYHGLCYTSGGALAGTRKNGMVFQQTMPYGPIPLTSAFKITVIFHVYIHLRFKQVVLGTHISCLGCLSRTVSLLLMRKKSVVTLHLPTVCLFFGVFYLTTYSTHFIYGYMASDMVKDHSDSERGNLLPPHGLLFPISSKGSFICTIP